MKRSLLATALLIAGLLVVSSGLLANAAGTHHPATKNRCPNNKKYLRAITATVHHGRVHIAGHHALFFCDKSAEFIKTRHADANFVVKKGASIKVYKNELDPSTTHPISAKDFPHYLAHHQNENWYTFKGKASAITSMKPAFQS
jgi:hypothetical protein